ncbi:MAG: protein kinase, partial [Planctomycetales bacterium]|nr:protein kinase [Planctomycetales bacterium]
MPLEQLEPDRLTEQVRHALTALADLVRHSEMPATESVLNDYPAIVADREAVLELIYTEYVLRQEQGIEISVDDWITRFPQLAQDLRELFQVHELLSDDGLARPESRRTHRVVDNADSQNLGKIGKCELLEEIGRGGMGIVYRARQDDLDRVVALKTISGNSDNHRSARKRFRTEAEAAARLTHPNIVQIHDVGDDGDIPYFTMEFVHGGNLRGFLREHPLRARPAADLVECLARA